MSTAWTMEIGSINRFAQTDDERYELWEILKGQTQRLAGGIEHAVRTLEIVLQTGLEWDLEEYLSDYILVYKQSHNASPIRYDDETQRITIIASGGGTSRTVKEYAARALCSLVYTYMMKHYNIGINIIEV